jgi:hypothetical protein
MSEHYPEAVMKALTPQSQKEALTKQRDAVEALVEGEPPAEMKEVLATAPHLHVGQGGSVTLASAMQQYIAIVKGVSPWYGATFFSCRSARVGGKLRDMRVGVGFSGIYLFSARATDMDAELLAYADIMHWNLLEDGQIFAFWLSEEEVGES